jgi:signal transduction histidine kinase
MTDPWQVQVTYAADVASANLRALWEEPAAPDPPARVWRDWVLVGVLLVVAVLEGLLRTDVVWRPLAIAMAVVAIVALLWRRTHPLLVVLVAFGSMFVVTVVGMVIGTASIGLYASACVLLLPYSLTRWGGGRAIVAGLAVIVVVGTLGVVSSYTEPVEAIAGAVFFLFPAVLGASVRYWDTAHERDVERARLREREQLARELHDTVAHHVSAMAIQAQAGRVLADTRPEAAVSALRVIETEASRALAEMRTMVGALRDGEAAELAPQRGIADIARLADLPAGDALVDVELSGDLDDLRPAVQSALYRMAQESLTNAVRHARRATRIDVRVVGDVDRVHLTVSDDGEPAPAGRSSYGYGLVGMKERATLLGGTFAAGPSTPRGWTVDAVLPRRTAAR